MGQQHVQRAAHSQIEYRYAGGAAQVQVAGVVVLVSRTLQFAEAQPFGIQGHHAPPGQVDASHLLVIHRLPRRTDVPVQVQHARRLFRELIGFVKQGGDDETGQRSIGQLADTIPLARFDHVFPLDIGPGCSPFVGYPLENHLVQHGSAQTPGFFFPGFGIGELESGYAVKQIRLQGIHRMTFMERRFRARRRRAGLPVHLLPGGVIHRSGSS